MLVNERRPRAEKLGAMAVCPRLLFITNIPAPYRVHLFNHLDQALVARGIGLKVLFMADTEPGRFWSCEPPAFRFSHTILPGLHPYVAGTPLHANPGAWIEVLRKPPTWLVIGGGWQFPTSFVLAFMTSMLSRNMRTLFWSEANIQAATHHRGPVAFFRRLVLKQADAFVVPGEIARRTIRDHWGIGDKPFIFLPNIVDETIYATRVKVARRDRLALRRQYDLKATDVVFFFPARLDECTKGILNFLRAVMPLSDSPLKVLIAGEGPDRSIIERWLVTNQESRVRLLGHLNQEQMVELYALSDVLTLPSFRDPNPLSVIEGMWAGLPLLISVNCGNWPEALQPGHNGWLVDPRHPYELRVAAAEALAMSQEELRAYGQRSQYLAKKQFATSKVVNEFADQLVQLLDEHPIGEPGVS